MGTPPPSKTDVLFTIQVRALAVGTTQFTAAEVQLGDLNANPLQTTVSGGMFRVQMPATATRLPTATRRSPTLTSTAMPIPSFVRIDQLTFARRGPGDEYPTIGQFEIGESTEILDIDSSGTWYRVRYLDTENAWISAAALSEIVREATSTPQSIFVIVKVASANLRSGPGTTYEIVGSVNQDEQLLVIAQAYDDSWYLITRSDGRLAWIAASIVDVSPTNAEIEPVATIPPTPNQPQLVAPTLVKGQTSNLVGGVYVGPFSSGVVAYPCVTGWGPGARELKTEPGGVITIAWVSVETSLTVVAGPQVVAQVGYWQVRTPDSTIGWIQASALCGPP